MIYNWQFKRTAIVVVLTIFILCACTHKTPIEKAKIFILEKKYDLAIAQFDIAIEQGYMEPDSVWDLCFSEGAKLLKDNNYKDANILSEYAIKLMVNWDYPSPESFDTYLSSMNNSDSIFNFVSKFLNVFPQYYENMTLKIAGLNPPEAAICKGYCESIKGEPYLFPVNSTPSFLEETFGLSTFNPYNISMLLYLTAEDINSISTEALVKSVDEDMLFFKTYAYVQLRLSKVPELSKDFADLRGKDEFKIAAERERVVKNIMKTRDAYITARFRYALTQFELSGKCLSYKADYDLDNQEADLHLFIDDLKEEGFYVATIRVPMSLEEASVFFSKDVVEGKVNYRVSPSGSTKRLGYYWGNQPHIAKPNLFIKENPIVIFETESKSTLKFTTDNFTGEMWPQEWKEYEYCKPSQKPKDEMIRIIFGKRI